MNDIIMLYLYINITSCDLLLYLLVYCNVQINCCLSSNNIRHIPFFISKKLFLFIFLQVNYEHHLMHTIGICRCENRDQRTESFIIVNCCSNTQVKKNTGKNLLAKKVTGHNLVNTKTVYESRYSIK